MKLRYESWHLLHLYAYVGPALPINSAPGQQFTGSPARAVFWWTLWALAAAGAVCFRLGHLLLLAPDPVHARG